MTIRRRMKQTGSLGDAIDARRREQQALEQRDTLGGSAAAPLSSGGSTAGGGGVTSDPALPESFVTGLAGGSGNPLLDGEITITGSGAATVTQDELAGEIDVHAPDYTAGDGLSLASEEFAVDSSVVRTSGNQAIAGLKTFSTAPQTPATPTNDDDLTNKDYVDERTKVVHRQVFPAAGSRDSVSGNNEINLPWVAAAYPTGASQASLTIDSNFGVVFPSTEEPATVSSSEVVFDWSSTQVSSVVVSGLQLVIAIPLPILTSLMNVKYRIKINNVIRVDAVFITICDDQGNSSPVSSENLISDLTSNSWTDIHVDNISTSGLDIQAFAILTVLGTSDSGNVGATTLSVQFAEIEQLE